MDYPGRTDGGAGESAGVVRCGNRAVQAEWLAVYPVDRARVVGLVTSVFTEFSETWILFSEIVDEWRCNFRNINYDPSCQTQTDTVNNTTHNTGDTMMSSTHTTAVVIDANGHFDDRTTVWFSGTAKAAIAYAKRNRNVQVVAGCESITGTVILRGALQTMVASGLWRVIG